MRNPSISIIIPAYNAQASIENIVKQILEQDFGDFELILVNDGSTDSTLELLYGLEKEDDRIVVVTKENGGPSSARNAGLEKVKGEYLVFFDADDHIMPDALGVLIRAIKTSGADLVISGWQIDLANNRKFVETYKSIQPPKETVDQEDLVRFTLRSIGTDGTLYNLWNKVFRTDIIKAHGLRFREDLRFGEDLLFGLEYIRKIHKMILIPNITYRYQIGSSTSVFSQSALVPEYRQINAKGLEKFVDTNYGRELGDLLNWVKWRWQLSYWIIVAGAKKISLSQKLQLIRENHDSKLEVAKSSQYIGSKKLWIERIANIVRRVPLLALLVGKAVHLLKLLIICIKSTIR